MAGASGPAPDPASFQMVMLSPSAFHSGLSDAEHLALMSPQALSKSPVAVGFTWKMTCAASLVNMNWSADAPAAGAAGACPWALSPEAAHSTAMLIAARMA